jgi:hypothetical protein
MDKKIVDEYSMDIGVYNLPGSREINAGIRVLGNEAFNKSWGEIYDIGFEELYNKLLHENL